MFKKLKTYLANLGLHSTQKQYKAQMANRECGLSKFHHNQVLATSFRSSSSDKEIAFYLSTGYSESLKHRKS